MIDPRSHVFPVVRWKRESATFVASDVPPTGEKVAAPAALVFPFYGDRVVLADISSRGWCIPSGHIEPGETAEEAVRREAHEEAGAILGAVAYIGYFILTDSETGVVRHAPTFIADVRGFEPLPDETESRGMQMVNIEDVAGLYFSWDALLASVFAYATEEKPHRLRVGVPLSALFEAGA